MKKIILSLLTASILTLGAMAQAATLSKGAPYTSAGKAALAGTAYHLNKAAGYKRYSTSDLKVTCNLGGSGHDQKLRVETKAKRANGKPVDAKIATVRQVGYRAFRVFLPNRHVFTPPR